MKCPYCGKETDKPVCPKCYAAVKKANVKKGETKNGN